MEILEKLRQQIRAESGGRERTDEDIDDQINRMSNVELLNMIQYTIIDRLETF